LTKLSDANNAGTRHAKDCTLILTEGDSAKALAVAGLGVVGRDNFGVFPLRGKLLNVREAKHDQIMKNEEIQNIKKIMGLQHNKDYSNVASLRYGRLMIMTDQVCLINITSCRELIRNRITMVLISKDCLSTFSTTSTLLF
jgi:DNA topoisomerase-2